MSANFKTSNKYSNFKIAWFQDKLNSLRTGDVIAPIYVRVKPTNRCCHNCYFCVYRNEYSGMHDLSDQKSEIPKDKLLEILQDFKTMGVRALTYSGGGEPLIYPNIVEIMEKTLEYGIDLSIITNGQLLDGKRADILKNAKWVRISMDYYDESSFSESRKQKPYFFNKIVENINNFSAGKNKNCDLTVNFIITKENYNKIYEAAELLKNLGVEIVRFSPVWTKDFFEYHYPISEQVFESLKLIRKDLDCDTYKIFDSYSIKKDQCVREYEKCYFMQIVPVIAADCNVYNCHNKSYTEDGLIGSLKDQSFSSLWFSEKTKKHFETFNPKNCCNCQCANDSKNIIIRDLINSYGDNYV